ncbi:MAG: succinyl-diaminopimelate desuccinylase [Rhizobiaceae bacterium]
MSLPTDPTANLAALVRCASVTPRDDGALDALADMIAPLGFETERPVFDEEGTPSIENLYARFGRSGPHLMFAGHTDVVPPGDEAAWTHPPFAAEIDGGEMFGRGTVDMKGGIACFVAAVARHVEEGAALPGSISLLVTGDEEGPAINGTVKLLQWAAEKGETWDAAIVGEPTNPEQLGDMIKIGRRGSLSGTITVHGKQGHVAYPHLADNPIRGLNSMVESLLHPAFDGGTEEFQPSNLEITTIDTGNPALNVIPGEAVASFNIRFNDLWDPDTVKAEIIARLERAAKHKKLRPGKTGNVEYEIVWRDRPSPVFLTQNDQLTGTLASSVEAITGLKPKLSTSGGTSDARFIKDYCPVVEFGLVGQTMHMVDERVALDDLEKLTAIYQRFVADWFAAAG